MRPALAACGACAVAAACSGSSGTSPGSPACPTSSGGADGIYPITALPSGACSAQSACDMLVRDCACNEMSGPVDRWSCPCIDGAWRCAIAVHGKDVCTCASAPDAGTDAPPPPPDGAKVDAGAPTWCETRTPPPAFCDDFDRGALGARWDFFQTAPPGVGTSDLATFVSPPAAFGVVTNNLTGPEFGTILLRKTLPSTVTRAHLGFELDADTAQPTGTLAVATLDLAVDHLLTLYLRDDDPGSPGPTLTEQPPGGAPAVRNVLPSVPAAGAWTRVEIDADGAAGTVTVAFGGATVLSGVPIAKGPIVQPTIRVGVLVSGPAAPYTMRFDDVTLDVTP